MPMDFALLLRWFKRLPSLLPDAALDIGFTHCLSEVNGAVQVMRPVCRAWAEAASAPLARTIGHTDIEWILRSGVGRKWLARHIGHWSGRQGLQVDIPTWNAATHDGPHAGAV